MRHGFVPLPSKGTPPVPFKNNFTLTLPYDQDRAIMIQTSSVTVSVVLCCLGPEWILPLWFLSLWTVL
jgi:hypothetical protein